MTEDETVKPRRAAFAVALAGLVFALAACASKATSGQAPQSPVASSSASNSPSPSPPSPPPAGCLDIKGALDAMNGVREQTIKYITDHMSGRTSAAALDVKRATAKMKTVEAMVEVDPALEAQAQALAADIVLGAGTDPSKQKAESEAFQRTPLEFAMLDTAIQQETTVPSC